MKLETRNQKPINKRREQIILYAPLLIWIGVIFLLSSGQGSMSRTSLIIRPILEFLFPNAPEATLLLYHGYIRKLAHFVEYAVLGFLACRAFFRATRDSLYRYRYVFAITLICLIATIDELQQNFHPSRTGSLFDAILDIAGGITAVVAFYLVRKG